MVRNAVHNAFLNTLTMGTLFPFVPAAFRQWNGVPTLLPRNDRWPSADTQKWRRANNMFAGPLPRPHTPQSSDVVYIPGMPWSRPRWMLSETRSVPIPCGGFSANRWTVTWSVTKRSNCWIDWPLRPRIKESMPPSDVTYSDRGRFNNCSSSTNVNHNINNNNNNNKTNYIGVT